MIVAVIMIMIVVTLSPMIVAMIMIVATLSQAEATHR